MSRLLLSIALCALAAGITFANTLENGFHLDDHYRIVGNPGLDAPAWKHFVAPETSSSLERIRAYRPLLPLSLSINRRLTGDGVTGFHLGNLLFQILASILAFLLGRELLRDEKLSDAMRDGAALVAALLFAVHPVSGILVNYLCARDQLLMELFLLAALLLYVQIATRGGARWRWPLALVAMALSLLSKTDAAVLPVLIVAYELTLGGASPLTLRPWLRAAPFAAVAVAFFAFTKLVLGFSDLSTVGAPSNSLLEYPLTQSRLHLFHYLRNFAWPFAIVQDPLVIPARGFGEPEVLLGLAFIIATLLVAHRFRRSAPAVSFGILAYWILIAPTSSVVALHQVATDYRPYPGSPFLFLALVLPLARLGRPLVAVALPALLFFASASVELNRTWRTEETLWMHSITHGGGALAHLNLAMAFPDRRDPRIQKNLRAALAMNPGFVLAHLDLGLWLLGNGDPVQGLAECRLAVSIEPGWAQSHHWLAQAYDQLGWTPEAEASSRRAAELEPTNAIYLRQAALDAQLAGSDLAAIALAERTMALVPDDAQLHFLRGFSLQRLGRDVEAIADYRRSLQLQPGQAQVEFNLGCALEKTGRCAEAVTLFEEAVRKNPALRAAGAVHLANCAAGLPRPLPE